MAKSWWLFSLFLFAVVCLGADRPFPVAPKSADEAEAQGLKRVDASTLAKTYGGIREAQNLKGEITRQELSSDGKLTYSNSNGVSGTGTWSVDESDGGAICRTFDFQGGRRFCTIYYAASDGMHLFGYNAKDKLWRITTRPAEAR
jgi:hypothetical protein